MSTFNAPQKRSNKEKCMHTYTYKWTKKFKIVKSKRAVMQNNLEIYQGQVS